MNNGKPSDLHTSVSKIDKHVLPSSVDQVTFTENSDGSYDVIFVPQEPGDYMIRIPGMNPLSVIGVKKEPKAELFPISVSEVQEYSTGEEIPLGKLRIMGKPHDVKIFIAKDGEPSSALKASLRRDNDPTTFTVVTTPHEPGNYSALLVSSGEVVASTPPVPVKLAEKVCQVA